MPQRTPVAGEHEINDALASRGYLSATDYFRGVMRPMSNSALDPFVFKGHSKLSPKRFLWTVQSRLLEKFARATYARNLATVRAGNPKHFFSECGADIADTFVTANQQRLLIDALSAADSIPGDVVEIGSFRGVTTVALARRTAKTVYAIDPFIGYGGSDQDYALFTSTVAALPNIRHLRKTSGAAASEFKGRPLALVFIDGVHDFSNSWFDFCAWSARLAKGGFVVLHDVDDFQGVTMTCARISKDPSFELWAYCPNIAIFRRLT